MAVPAVRSRSSAAVSTACRSTAQFAPGELSFTQHSISRPPVTVLGARETTDRVSIPPLGNCFIAQLQTPTATLALAMPGGQLALAVQDLTRSE